MNSKHTFTWFILAVLLLAFIVGYRFFERSQAVEPLEMLSNLRPLAVTGVQVSPRDTAEICVVNTNGGWFLTQPVAYPAQVSAIESLLTALQKLKPVVRIGSAEISQNHSEFGFNSPWASLVIQSGDERREILVGNKTPPGDGVYVQVVGRDGVFITDIDWLKYIPQTANDWRDTSLAGDTTGCDSIVLTNGTKIIELRRDAASHLWKMIHPLTARANGDYIADALQKLQTAHVSQFITDNPNADMSAFGLQPANLDLWFDQGSNVLTSVHVGKASTNDSTEVFAKRDRWNTVLTTPAQPLSSWMGAVNDFRDPYLLELTAPVAEIEMIGPGTNHFILRRQAANAWTIPGQTFPVDADSVQSLIQMLAGLRVSEFVKDVATPTDLAAHGLATPSRQIILRSAGGDTNAVIAQLLFGAARTNEVFVQRSDENSVYAISPEDFGGLPAGPVWQFRERRLWNFAEGDIAEIAVHQNGKTLEVLHNGPNKWSLAPGSQGIINPQGLEYLAHDLGDLAVGSSAAWAARGVANPANYGLKPGNLSLTVTLKNRDTTTVDFGLQLGQTALAAVTLDGERWVFIFPPDLYLLIMSYLPVSPNVP
ncbi:MAG TPA: DUF4340 domain-containing protein [Verrucomicrobiae bacterium]